MSKEAVSQLCRLPHPTRLRGSIAPAAPSSTPEPGGARTVRPDPGTVPAPLCVSAASGRCRGVSGRYNTGGVGAGCSCTAGEQRCCECGACAGEAGEPKRRIISAGGLVPRRSAARLLGAGVEGAPSGGGHVRGAVSGRGTATGFFDSPMHPPGSAAQSSVTPVATVNAVLLCRYPSKLSVF